MTWPLAADLSNTLTIIHHIVMVVMALSLLFGLLRVCLGPTLADRIVALDFMALVFMSIAAMLSVIYGQSHLLDVAIVIGLISFLSTLALARYLEWRSQDK